jgi:hypothetical protein
MSRLCRGLCGAMLRTASAVSALAASQSAYGQPASDPTQEHPTPYVPPGDFSLHVHAGNTVYRTKTRGIFAGVDALVRQGILAAGGNAEAAFFGLDLQMLSIAALGGFAWRAKSGPRLDVLATAGAHYYMVKGDFFDDDPGTSATLPYAGGLVSATYLFAPSARGHFSLGLLGSLDTDLVRVHRQYSYTQTGWDTAHTAWADHTMGGTHYSIALSVGGVSDFGWQ